MALSTRGHGCCFPVMSFLHVPGKMSQPLWLMMGTAFLLQAAHGTAASGRQFLLSAKHTFAPWQFIADPTRLKIPEEYRKTRFVVVRLYLPDDAGRAIAGSKVDLRLVALHPSLDVALLALNFAAAASSGKSEPNAHAEEVRRLAETVGGGLALSAADPAVGDSCLVSGYRGVGSLGLLDTADPDLLRRLSAAQRDELLAKLKCVEGEQVAVTSRVEVLHASGMCRATQGRCYHGMSGAPVLVNGYTCGGVLYGKHTEHAGYLGYTPARSLDAWVRRTVGAG
ncbi:putative serine protease PepD [Trypanosoma conorhini]|uniref:Putative serine protease PepD n=1 Tax=Trypanosoma conorhini TaxID=83891 RepID=A0A3R7RTP9_9TRYP|nr:putative serine protease PepD [Trypanosoma conorhini]RNF12721.1 putative serine protease PepD [Trypanosoma conorhini]